MTCLGSSPVQVQVKNQGKGNTGLQRLQAIVRRNVVCGVVKCLTKGPSMGFFVLHASAWTFCMQRFEEVMGMPAQQHFVHTTKRPCL